MRRILWIGMLGAVAVVLLGAAFFVGMAIAQPIGQRAAAAQTGVAVIPALPVASLIPTPLAPPEVSSDGYNTWGSMTGMKRDSGWGMGDYCCDYGSGWPGIHGGGGSRMPGWRMGMHWGYTNTVLIQVAIPPATTDDVSYQADIQPIIDARCVFCHGGTQGLYLSDYASVMRGGRQGPVIIPGDPASSRLIRYVGSGYMPMGGPTLTQDQIQRLVNWVAAGAPNN